MGKRTSYEPGTFCWIELATPDAGGAQVFYGDLFGWGAEGSSARTMLRLAGDAVAALAEQEGPAGWLSCVSVEDAAAAGERARELGGTVVGELFEHPRQGRLLAIRDPLGATFAVWQPLGHIGAERVNEPGCLCWNDLGTADLEAAGRFYGDLFGWIVERIDTGPGGPEIASVKNRGGWPNGTMRGLTDADVPAAWLPYFAAESCAEQVARVRRLEGEVLVEPMDIPAGRMAVVHDPQGATFGLAEGAMDD